MRIAVLVLLFALSGCGGGSGSSEAADPSQPASPSSSRPETFTITGEIRVPLDAYYSVKQPGDPVIGSTKCRAEDGYDDIEPGAQVTVRSGDGDTLGLGSLAVGKLGGKGGKALILTPCAFAFEVADVPIDEDFYSIEVAHRGEVSYERVDLLAPVVLTLGD